MRRTCRGRPWERRRPAGTREARDDADAGETPALPGRCVHRHNENRCGRTRALAGGVAPGYSRRMSSANSDAHAAVKALAGVGAGPKTRSCRFRGPTVAAVELLQDEP